MTVFVIESFLMYQFGKMMAFKKKIFFTHDGEFGSPYPGKATAATRQEQSYPVLQVHAGSFRVSVIHQTLTWTTGILTCVRDHSYACIYI